MISDSELIGRYKQRASSNNKIEQISHSSMSVNGMQIQGGTNTVSKQTKISRSKPRNKTVEKNKYPVKILYFDQATRKYYVGGDREEPEFIYEYPESRVSGGNTYNLNGTDATLDNVGDTLDDWIFTIVVRYSRTVPPVPPALNSTTEYLQNVQIVSPQYSQTEYVTTQNPLGGKEYQHISAYRQSFMNCKHWGAVHQGDLTSLVIGSTDIPPLFEYPVFDLDQEPRFGNPLPVDPDPRFPNWQIFTKAERDANSYFSICNFFATANAYTRINATNIAGSNYLAWGTERDRFTGLYYGVDPIFPKGKFGIRDLGLSDITFTNFDNLTFDIVQARLTNTPLPTPKENKREYLLPYLPSVVNGFPSNLSICEYSNEIVLNGLSKFYKANLDYGNNQALQVVTLYFTSYTNTGLLEIPNLFNAVKKVETVNISLSFDSPATYYKAPEVIQTTSQYYDSVNEINYGFSLISYSGYTSLWDAGRISNFGRDFTAYNNYIAYMEASPKVDRREVKLSINDTTVLNNREGEIKPLYNLCSTNSIVSIFEKTNIETFQQNASITYGQGVQTLAGVDVQSIDFTATTNSWSYDYRSGLIILDDDGIEHIVPNTYPVTSTRTGIEKVNFNRWISLVNTDFRDDIFTVLWFENRFYVTGNLYVELQGSYGEDSLYNYDYQYPFQVYLNEYVYGANKNLIALKDLTVTSAADFDDTTKFLPVKDWRIAFAEDNGIEYEVSGNTVTYIEAEVVPVTIYEYDENYVLTRVDDVVAPIYPLTEDYAIIAESYFADV